MRDCHSSKIRLRKFYSQDVSSRPEKTVKLLMLILISSLFISFPAAGDSVPAGRMSLPHDYGEIICTINEDSPYHLYIIGMSHRDTLTGAAGDSTSRVQAEVYRIGEWLIENRGVQLLLPEGFFSEKQQEGSDSKPRYAQPASSVVKQVKQPTSYLERILADNRSYVNAEMLLRANYPLKMKQVEDKNLYFSVFRRIEELSHCSGKDIENLFRLKSELDYHQKKRVGAMLQRIPGIILHEFETGGIKSKKALFTIGLSHISNIIGYVNERKIAICPPLFSRTGYDDYIDDLELAKQNFGISIVIPRSLMDDYELLNNRPAGGRTLRNS